LLQSIVRTIRSTNNNIQSEMGFEHTLLSRDDGSVLLSWDYEW
jgi:hypothetical protein